MPARVSSAPMVGRVPPTAANSNGGTTDLFLDAQRRAMATKKASSAAAAASESSVPTSNSIGEFEALKEKLRDQTIRLSSASLRRPAPAAAAAASQHNHQAATHQPHTSAFLHGERYTTRPFQPLVPRIMWEPFSNDREVQEWSERVKLTELRLEHRADSWRGEWHRRAREQEESARKGQRGAPPDAPRIPAPEPPVYSARNDQDFRNMVEAADEFMATGKPSIKSPVRSRPSTSDHTATGTGASHRPNVTITGQPESSEVPVVGGAASQPGGGDALACSTPTVFTTHGRPSSAGAVGRPSSAQRRSFARKQSMAEMARTEYTAALLRKRRATGAISESAADLLNGVVLSVGTDGKPLDLSSEIVEPVLTDDLRCGTVLGPSLILKRDFWVESFARPEVAGLIANAPCFRVIPRFNVASVASAHVSGIRAVLNTVLDAWAGQVGYISLREELTVYLNGRCYVVREHAHPSEPLPAPDSVKQIEALEDKLTKEIIDESRNAAGNVIIHKETNAGAVIVQWESVEPANVITPRRLFSQLVSEPEYEEVVYDRIPFISHGSVSTQAVDRIVAMCERLPPMAPIVFSCLTGRGRSTMGVMIAALYRLHRHNSADLNKICDGSSLVGDHPAVTKHIMRVIGLLPDGLRQENIVANMSKLSGHQNSLVERITQAFKSDAASKIGRELLLRYCHLTCFSAYLAAILAPPDVSVGTAHQPGPPTTAITQTYPQWMDAMPELQLVLDAIRADDSQAGETFDDASFSPGSNGDLLSPGRRTDPQVEKAMRDRVGQVLTQGTVLRDCSQSFGACLNHIPGVQALRQLAPKVPIFTVGPLSVRGRTALLLAISSAFPKAKKCLFLDVRSEPMVYIDDTPFTVGDAIQFLKDPSVAASHNNSWGSSHMTAPTIANVEQRLKGDIRAEAADCANGLLVHKPDSANGSSPVAAMEWISIPHHPHSTYIKTAKESFSAGWDVPGVDVIYARVPMASGEHSFEGDIAAMLHCIFSNAETRDAVADPSTVVVIHDNEGGVRTTFALNLVTLALAARRSLGAEGPHSLAGLTSPDAVVQALAVDVQGGSGVVTTSHTFNVDDESRYANLNAGRIELHVASQLSQMLGAGQLLATVEAAAQLGGRGTRWNLLDRIASEIEAAQQSIGDERKTLQARSLRFIQKYLYLIVVAAFLDEVQLQQRTPSSARRSLPTLHDWIRAHDQIGITFLKMLENPKASMKLVSAQDFFLETPDGGGTSVSRRRGRVITANFGLKADHFPGSQRKGMTPAVHGAPNFRKVDGVNIYGVAIPTVQGVHNVLALLGAHTTQYVAAPGEDVDTALPLIFPRPGVFSRKATAGEPGAPPSPRVRHRVIWCNMREEPLIYVGNRPFVFRDFSNPYVNVEMTGIDPIRIEHIEKLMQDDVLTEGKQFQNRYLVHDEGAPGQLVGQWEPATLETIKTVRQLYDDLAKQDQVNVQFSRFPVTDEQAPEEKDFDYLIQALLPVVASLPQPDGGANDPAECISLVFNCQMGRGRTTTGMVVAAMIVGLVFPEYNTFLEEQLPAHILYPATESPFEHGNYRIVGQVQRLLVDGPQAKQRTDRAINACGRFQNLRAAIEGFKKTVESVDSNDGQRHTALHHGKHYLMRYFFLIIFNSFLHEQYDRESRTLRMSFVQWMDSRKELRGWEHRVELK